METALYRRNVFKTLGVKPAKAGLRYASRNTARTNVLHAAVGLATEVGELIEVMENYLLIGRSTAEEKNLALEEMGDFAYYMMVMAKITKAKVPGSGKKLKLEGTRGAALLNLQRLIIGDKGVLDIAKKAVFHGPVMTETMAPEKTRKIKGVDVVIAAHAVAVMDVAAQAAADVLIMASMKAKIEAVIDLFYRLTFDMFGQPPAYVFAGNIAKLELRYGGGVFEHAKAKAVVDKAGEAAAIAGASAAVAPTGPAVKVAKVKKVKVPKAPTAAPAAAAPAAG